jgi:hypothetical protein
MEEQGGIKPPKNYFADSSINHSGIVPKNKS